MFGCCKPKVERQNLKIQPEEIKNPDVQKGQLEVNTKHNPNTHEANYSSKPHLTKDNRKPNEEPTAKESSITDKVTERKDKDIELIPIAHTTIQETISNRDEKDRPPPPKSFARETQKNVVVVKPREEEDFEIKYHGDASSKFQSSLHPFGSSGE